MRITPFLEYGMYAGSQTSSGAELALTAVQPEMQCTDNPAHDAPRADDEAGDGCVLEDSLWDASILVCMKGQGLASSAWSVMLLLVNCLVQAILTVIVLVDLTEEEIGNETAAGFRAWRANIAQSLYACIHAHMHIVHGHVHARIVCIHTRIDMYSCMGTCMHAFRKHFDSISGLSLAARVCADDEGLQFNSQADAFQAIQRYEKIGMPLLVMCLFVWFNNVISDLSAAFRMMAVVVELRGAETTIVTSAAGKMRIKVLSNHRVAWFVFVQTARLVIAVLLGYGQCPMHACMCVCMAAFLRSK